MRTGKTSEPIHAQLTTNCGLALQTADNRQQNVDARFSPSTRPDALAPATHGRYHCPPVSKKCCRHKLWLAKTKPVHNSRMLGIYGTSDMLLCTNPRLYRSHFPCEPPTPQWGIIYSIRSRWIFLCTKWSWPVSLCRMPRHASSLWRVIQPRRPGRRR